MGSSLRHARRMEPLLVEQRRAGSAWGLAASLETTSRAQGRSQAMAFVSRYCSNPSRPFWRPMPLAL